jgi:pyruvate/2-oxoglutarate dehydrogenase complex dihydrolipoamide dehydrogenase (E3) component
MERVRQVRAHISEHDSVYKFAKKYGIDIYLGEAKFISPKEIEVNGKVLQYAKACIATGGRPSIPEISGIEDFPYFTSENIFNITEQPKNLLVIGTGPIG